MVADLQIEAEEANGGVLLTVVDSARLTMLLTMRCTWMERCSPPPLLLLFRIIPIPSSLAFGTRVVAPAPTGAGGCGLGSCT